MGIVNSKLAEIISTLQRLESDQGLVETIELAAEKMTETYRNGNKVLFCGNGGSASDAQHLAAELSGRFYLDRKPLPAEALHVNTSFLTAVANDYGYESVYERMIRAIGNSGDVLIGISTSGNSVNVINAFHEAKKLGVYTIALCGEKGGSMAEIADLRICAPSSDTPRIQECHIHIGHSLCEIVERNLFGS